MSKKKEVELDQFIILLGQTIRNHGLAKVVESLRGLDIKQKIDSDQEIIDTIIFKACEAYQTSREDVMKSTKRGAITQARKTCFILFKEHLTFSLKEIGQFFDNRNEKVVRKAIEYFKSLNKKVKEERFFFEKYEEINTYINSIKQGMISKYSELTTK